MNAASAMAQGRLVATVAAGLAPRSARYAMEVEKRHVVRAATALCNAGPAPALDRLMPVSVAANNRLSYEVNH